MFDSVRLPFVLMLISMNLSVSNDTILANVDTSPHSLWLSLLGSWAIQIPFIAISVYIKKDIISLYYGAAIGYSIQCTLQFLYLFNKNWHKYSDEAK